MPLNIRNEAVNQLAKKLAARKHVNKTDAVQLALERERLRPLQNRILARPATGLKADKAFYDELSEET